MIDLSTLLRHRIVLVLAFVVLAGAVAGEAATGVAELRRDLVMQGEFWRLLTAHVVHAGWAHALLVLAGLALTWLLVHRAFHERQWLIILLAGSVGISLVLLWRDLQATSYVGLSGVVHLLAAAGVIGLWRRQPPLARFLAAVLVLKLAVEQLLGDVAGTATLIGAPVLVNAHLYGVLHGVFLGGFATFLEKRHPGQHGDRH